MTNEFKIDKLGWYEILDEGNESICTGKCIFIDEETKHSIMKIDKNLYPFDEKGYCTDSSHHIYKKLIKYLSPDLQKEPRKFEFEAWIGESSGDISQFPSDYLLSNVLGTYCSACLHSEPTEWPKNSKWQVTMKEIIE